MIKLAITINTVEYAKKENLCIEVAGKCDCKNCKGKERAIRDLLPKTLLLETIKKNDKIEFFNSDVTEIAELISFLTYKVLLGNKTDCQSVFSDNKVWICEKDGIMKQINSGDNVE